MRIVFMSGVKILLLRSEMLFREYAIMLGYKLESLRDSA